MRRTALSLLATTALLLLTAQPDLKSQETLFGIGPKAGLYLKGHPMVGAVAEIPITRNIYVEPGLELILPGNNTTRITLDLNGRYAFRPRGESFSPFLLGGLALATDFVSINEESATNTSLLFNLGGGLFLNTRSATQYWLGLKAVIGEGDSDVLLQGGIVWYL